MTNEKDNPQMDWQQVALNGGPPCFALAGDADTHYCGRAQRWAGHDNHHKFVSLDDLLSTARNEERGAAFLEAADYIRRQWLAAYPVEVFPEPPKPPAECSRDRISAAMGRHMAVKLIEHFEVAASTNEKNDT